jgi:hypothetical protein
VRIHRCRVCGQDGHNRVTCPLTQGAHSRAMPLLGTMTDAQVAATVGCRPSTVAAWRKRRGIPHLSVPDTDERYPGMVERFGVDTDAAIAADYGISRERVRQIRSRRGIPRAGGGPLTLPDEVVPLLGTASDARIARQYGVPMWLVRQGRLVRGIPVKSVQPDYDRILEPAIDRIGTVSDRDIADELGVPIAQVAAFRQRRGIPPFRLSPKCEAFVPIDRDAIIRLFHAGATDDEIAAAVGTTPGNIGTIRTGELRLLRGVAAPHVTPEQTDAILRMHDAGSAAWSISKAVGVSHTTARRIIRKNRPA